MSQKLIVPPNITLPVCDVDATIRICLNVVMLTYQDEQRVREIVKKEIAPVIETTNRTANNVDKILKIVTSSNQEHFLTKAKVNKLEKRTAKIERKLKMPSASTSVIFA